MCLIAIHTFSYPDLDHDLGLYLYLYHDHDHVCSWMNAFYNHFGLSYDHHHCYTCGKEIDGKNHYINSFTILIDGERVNVV